MQFKILKLNKNSSGFVILFAVVFSAIILAVGLGVANIALKEISFGTSARASNNSFLAADLGVECALYSDKTSINAFEFTDDGIDTEGDVQVNCMAGAPPLETDFSVENSLGVWRFVIPPDYGTLDQDYCAIVEVIKDRTSYYTKTDIISKGFNMGDSGGGCDSGSQNLVERQLEVTYSVGARIASDDFVEDSVSGNVSITEHTPTGVNRGSGWVMQYQDSNPTPMVEAIVNATSDKVTDNFNNNVIRYKMTDDLLSDDMSISANFTTSPTTAAPIFFGLTGRLPYSSTGSKGIEAFYNRNAGKWVLTDGNAATQQQLIEALPASQPFNMKLLIQSGTAELFVNGTLKLTLTTSAFAGQRSAGIIIGNNTTASGGAPNQITIDDYESIGF